MPVTKHFSTRIELLDELLASSKRRTRTDLLKALNEKLRQQDINPISERSLTNDLKYLKEKDAPLAAVKKGQPFYYYTEPFSIRTSPLSGLEVKQLRQAIDLLRKATPLTMVNELEHLMNRLSNQVHTTRAGRKRDIVQFEDHTSASGQEWLDTLFNAIADQQALRIQYRPFGKKKFPSCVFHPYMLKEYRKRWFVIGRIGTDGYITTFALDRIQAIETTLSEYLPNDLFQPDEIFQEVVGVSLPRKGSPEKITVLVRPSAVPYIVSKPLHRAQKIVHQYEEGDMLVELLLIINHELKSLILGYGSSVEVLAPFHFRETLRAEIDRLHQAYQVE